MATFVCEGVDGPRQCAFCSTSFALTVPTKRFCSRACKKRANSRAGTSLVRVCSWCSSQFNPKRTDRIRFCGRACSFSAAAKEKAEREIERQQRLLAQLPIQGPPEPPLCSCGSYIRHKFARGLCDQCRIARSKKVKAAYLIRSKGKPRLPSKNAARLARKLRERAVAVETVDPIKVFQRDEWRCQMCGVQTPRRLRGTYDAAAPELDHIIPISRGGEHSYRNVQCACRSCNALKRDRPLGQLRLFG